MWALQRVRAGGPRRAGGRCAAGLRLLTVLVLLLALTTALVPAAPASAQEDRWVAVGGRDADNDCTDPNQPCGSIQHAVDLAQPGDTIHLTAGTYRQDVTLPPDKHDLTLAGAGAGQTVIVGQAGGSPYTITLTSPGAIIQGLTLDRPAAGVEDSIGIAWGYQASGATVRDVTVTGYPTAIYVASGVEGGTIAGNTITGNGNGILLEGAASDLAIHGNDLTGNNVTALEPEGGAAIRVLPEFTGSGIAIRFNRIAGNGDGMGINNQSAAVLDATDNWWGCNEAPGEDGCDTVAGMANLDPWLVLRVSAAPDTVAVGDEATITAALTANSAGEDRAEEGTLPDGIPVAFTLDPSDAGTLEPASASTARGVATTVFTGRGAGTATIAAAVDNATASTTVDVQAPAPEVNAITLAASTTTPTAGQEVALTATVVDAQDAPVAGVTVRFVVDGVHEAQGQATTNDEGEATFRYTGTVAGEDVVTATVDRDGNGQADEGEPQATVTLTWTVASPPPPSRHPATEPAQPMPGCVYFPETQHNLCFGFRSYWERFGGLATFGYPLTEEFVENGRTVQYFERARFEWHPGVWPERFDVLLGLVGNEVTADRRAEVPFQPADAGAAAHCTYFAATGHNLCFGFRSYWERFGGLAVFGYPISEEFVERNPDTGQLYTVQYFERARFEWHPGEWPERFDVLVGRLGAQVLAQRVGSSD
ncbi:MAG: pectinesterase family protein [Sphaerobacter sp.]|nr:pectinesterase family protein [Sphaerobacter sp.]